MFQTLILPFTKHLSSNIGQKYMWTTFLLIFPKTKTDSTLFPFLHLAGRFHGGGISEWNQNHLLLWLRSRWCRLDPGFPFYVHRQQWELYLSFYTQIFSTPSACASFCFPQIMKILYSLLNNYIFIDNTNRFVWVYFC